MPGDEQEVTRLRALAISGTAGLQAATQWESWLRHAERFTKYGFTNTMLIWAQHPGAIRLTDYAGWKRLGRQVIRGEHGTQLISPRGNLVTVFDLFQTEGKPVPIRRRVITDPAAARDALASLALRSGFRVAEPHSPQSTPATWDDKIISAPRGDITALARQVAHILVHDDSHGDSCDRGVAKVETASVAYLISLRLGLDTSPITFPHVTTWAGTDKRAHPEATIARTGERILRAAASAFDCLDANTPQVIRLVTGPRLARTTRTPANGELVKALQAAAKYYTEQLPRSWVPGYLAGRGLNQDTLAQWGIGYAPPSWTALTDHLRSLGFADNVLEEAGLAKRSRRGTLYDVFRDRAMFPVRSRSGEILGFTGRANPDAETGTPKYLNTRETPLYRKSHLLFGLHEARQYLANGARPVIVEGPLDAIAVTTAGDGKYAGVAACGTALTAEHVSQLSRLSRNQVLVAFDSDAAGQAAAVRTHGLFGNQGVAPLAVAFPSGTDPADLLARDGPPALLQALDNSTHPLADLVIDARLAGFTRSLEFIDGKFNALDAVAPLIARLPTNQVARQVARVADHTGLTYGEVTGAVTEAVHELIRSRDNPARIAAKDRVHLGSGRGVGYSGPLPARRPESTAGRRGRSR